MSDTYEKLQERIRETPLLERLDQARTMIGKMCKEHRGPKMSIPVQHYDEDIFINTALMDARNQLIAPVDLLLFCPNCHTQHVDEARPDVCETCGHAESDCTCPKYTAWLNPPHKSHRCTSCNFVWRPADVPTNGVRAIKTKGERDSE